METIDINHGERHEPDPIVMDQTPQENEAYITDRMADIARGMLGMEPEQPEPEQPTEPEAAPTEEPAPIEAEATETKEPEPSFSYPEVEQQPQMPPEMVQKYLQLEHDRNLIDQVIRQHERNPARNSEDQRTKAEWLLQKQEMLQTRQMNGEALLTFQNQFVKFQETANRDLMQKNAAKWDAEMKQIAPEFDDLMRMDIVNYLRGKGISDERIAQYTPKEAKAYHQQLLAERKAEADARAKTQAPARPEPTAEQLRGQRMKDAESRIRKANIPLGSIEAAQERLVAQWGPRDPVELGTRLKNAPGRTISTESLENRLKQTGSTRDAEELIFRRIQGQRAQREKAAAKASDPMSRLQKTGSLDDARDVLLNRMMNRRSA